MAARKYPIGIQSFEKLINSGYMYVDKTEIIYNLITGGEFYFLSRPRRFGKSLLVSTLKAYFQGKKELFKGLAMEKLENEWTQREVIHIDFSGSKYYDTESLKNSLNFMLCEFEETYGKHPEARNFGDRLKYIIEKAREKSGKQVVVLIDEYDAPLLDVISNEELKVDMRNILRDLFSPLKKQGENICFLLLTGISKFSQLSIFSELNNLTNISMLPQYAAICGITEEELIENFQEEITALGEQNGETHEEAFAHLKHMYDGYHFSHTCPDIYNPFSLLHVLAFKEYNNYWFGSGTPTFLIELIKKFNVNIKDLEGVGAKAADFDKATDTITNHIPVFYQSGYITIKEYDPILKMYTLGYPNEEVRASFADNLLPIAIPDYDPLNQDFFIANYIRDLMNNDVELFLRRMQAFFSSISNKMLNKTEKDFQNIIYLLSIVMGQIVRVEEDSAIGRSDLVIELSDRVYIFEFKFEDSAPNALAQIKTKNYAAKYAVSPKKVVKVGINFSSTTRTLDSWVIEG